MRSGTAEVIVVRQDGAVIMQQRDDKPGIANPGRVACFGGHIEPHETPLQAAVRELGEETNLAVSEQDLQFFGTYRKTKAIHGTDEDIYYFICRNVDDAGLNIYEGRGFVIIHNLDELLHAKTSLLARQVLTDFFSLHK